MANTTWNPADSLNVTLSNANLTATGTGAGGVRSTLSTSSGKYYWETTTGNIVSSNTGIGAANTSAILSTMGSSASNVAFVYGSGNVYINGGLQSGLGSIGTAGTVVCFALDVGARLMWFRNGAAGLWNASGTANPATATGGWSVSSIFSAAAAFAAVSPGQSGDAFTANFGDSAFTGVVPAGFTAGFLGGGGGGGGGNTFDPAFNTANFTLTNGNLTATGVLSSNNQNTRTVAGFTSGKVYWEMTMNVIGGSQGVGVGIENPNNGSGFLGATLYGWCYAAAGPYYNNGAITTTWSSMGAGSVVSVAVDITNKKLWLRYNALNWNNTAGNDPATNVGGTDLTTLLANNGTVYPAMNSWQAGDRVTANFGGSAFAQTVPSGFVALDNLGGGGAAQARALVLA